MRDTFRRRHIFLGIGCALLGAYALSTLLFVRNYGDDAVVQLGDGVFAVFWGGDPHVRNGCVYNASEWPVKPETHFAGGDPGDMRWECYGPRLAWSYLRDGAVRRVLGLRWPEINCGGDNRDPAARSLVLPLIIPAAVAGLFIVRSALRALARRRARRRGFAVVTQQAGTSQLL